VLQFLIHGPSAAFVVFDWIAEADVDATLIFSFPAASNPQLVKYPSCLSITSWN
jgi:hypothetical protein